MRKWITFLMTFLVGSSVYADYSQVSFFAGYRRDELSTHFKFPSHDPFIEISDRFKDLDIFQIGVAARTQLGCNFYLRACADWGWILDGNYDRRLSLFVGGSDAGEISFNNESEDVVDGQYVYDFSIAIGYPFYFCDCQASISPVIGYAFNGQNIEVDSVEFGGFGWGDDGDFGATSEFGCCCDAKFHNHWYGPFIGLDLMYNTCECWNFYATVQYHFARFKSRTHAHIGGFGDDWNHHHHRGKHAHGWTALVGAQYDFQNCWTAGINLDWKDFRTSRTHHHDGDFSSDFEEVFFGSSESGCCNTDRARNKHRWHSFAVNFTVGRGF